MAYRDIPDGLLLVHRSKILDRCLSEKRGFIVQDQVFRVQLRCDIRNAVPGVAVL